MSKKDDGKSWFSSVYHKHTGGRGAKYIILTTEPNSSNSLGFQVDVEPFEGKVVDESGEWLLVKAGPQK